MAETIIASVRIEPSPNALSSEQRAFFDVIQRQRMLYTFNPDKVRLFRNYARGKHKITLSTKQQKSLQHILGNDFCDNICAQVIFEARSRINFLKWACEDKSVDRFLKTTFTKTNMISKQESAHNGMLVDGNHLYAVNYDPKYQRTEIYRERWWDGQQGAFMGYDELGRPLFVVKDWQQLDGTWRRVIWFEDHLERYRGMSPQGMQPYNLPSDPVQNGLPIPWLDFDGKPLGLPFVHLPNGFRMEDNDLYGLSELDHGITGFQDQITALHWGMSVGAELTAHQMYYQTGVGLINPITKKPIEPKVGGGEVWLNTSKDARMGRIEAGNMKPVIEVFDEKLERISSVTATPVHRLKGKDWPSGEALMRAEQPAVNKGQKQLAKIDDPYRHLGYLAVKIENRFGSGQPLPTDIETALISPEFADPEGRDPLSRSVIANNMADKGSIEEYWRIMGRSDEQVERIIKERTQNIKDGIIANPDKAAGNGGGANDKGSQPNPQDNKIQQQQKPINGDN